MGRKRTTYEDVCKRIDSIVPDEYGCWNWHKWTDRYPIVLINGSPVRVHRLALERKLGRPIKDGMFACHHCDNPGCCNPSHIYEGDAAANIRDMRERNPDFRETARRTWAARGMAWGTRTAQKAKLTVEEREARRAEKEARMQAAWSARVAEKAARAAEREARVQAAWDKKAAERAARAAARRAALGDQEVAWRAKQAEKRAAEKAARLAERKELTALRATLKEEDAARLAKKEARAQRDIQNALIKAKNAAIAVVWELWQADDQEAQGVERSGKDLLRASERLGAAKAWQQLSLIQQYRNRNLAMSAPGVVEVSSAWIRSENGDLKLCTTYSERQ